jgi:hypothetical protein
MKPQPKLKAIRDPEYLAWIKKQICVLDWIEKLSHDDIVPAHQNLPIPSSCKGTSNKNHDIWALPMHYTEHLQEHNGEIKITNEQKMKLVLEHLVRYKPSLVEDVLEYVTRNWEILK